MTAFRTIKSSELDAAFFAPRLSSGAEDVVRDVIRNVRERGDKAVLEYGEKFDGVLRTSLRIDSSLLQEAELLLKKESPDVYDALCLSRDLALNFAKKQRACFTDFETELLSGLFTGQKTIPIERAGIYIPAGRFPLLSSAVMTLCPAIAAGVKEIAVCTPPKKNAGDEKILAAISICSAMRNDAQKPVVFAAGGAQAVAAMAFGTQSIPACDVIVGPGNKYVAEAKRQIFGQAGIDILAGPTEVLIIADGSARADFVAADMLAQAEHDIDAQAILVTTSQSLAAAVQSEIEKQLTTLSTADTARAALKANGVIILVDSLEEAVNIANKKAPEHLEISVSHNDEAFLKKKLINYGSLFIGHRAAEVLGDYSAGLNHTLPTSGAARWTGGLSVRCFLKTVTTLRAENGSGVEQSLKAASILGRAEGLEGHAAAAEIRLKQM